MTTQATRALMQAASILRSVHNEPDLAERFEAAAAAEPHKLRVSRSELERLNNMTLPIEVSAGLQELAEVYDSQL